MPTDWTWKALLNQLVTRRESGKRLMQNPVPEGSVNAILALSGPAGSGRSTLEVRLKTAVQKVANKEMICTITVALTLTSVTLH